MTKDRIDQLRAGAPGSRKVKNIPKVEEEEDLEENELTSLTTQGVKPIIKGVKSKEKHDLAIPQKHANDIICCIGLIQEDIIQLKKFHVRIQQATRPEASLREQIEDLNENIKVTAVKVKRGLQDLENGKKGDEDNVLNRVVKAQHSMLSKRFKEIIEDYENCLISHKKNSEDLIKKQLQIVVEMLLRKVTYVPADRQVSDEELLEILDTEDVAVFVDNYTKETLEARLSLQDARDRYKEVLNVEKQISLVRELFFDIALHVTQQGELIDRIEYHIGNGYVMTQKGHKKLNKAEVFMKKARKKKVWLFILLFSIIAIFVLYIAFQLNTK